MTKRPALFIIAFAVLAAAGCGDAYQPPLPDRGQLHYPVGQTLHPNGRYLYVVNSNFNARFQPDSGGTVAVIDTRTLEIQKERSPFLPSFGGAIELNDDASRAYVTARQDNTLVSFRVAGPQSNAPAGGALYCLDEEGNPTSNPAPCSLQKVSTNGETARLGTDPFGLAVTTVRRDDPGTETEEKVPVDLVNLSYLGSEQVTTVSLPDRDLSAASMATAALVRGGNRIVQRPGSLSYYVAGRDTNVVARFSPFVNFREKGSFGEVQALFQQGRIPLSNFSSRQGGSVAADARGLAFDDAGERLFVATRQPDALHVFNLVAEDRETGEGLAHAWAGSVPLPDNPSDILYHEDPRGRPRLYIPSFADNTVSVVDPEGLTVLGTIELNASPHEIVVDTADDRCRQPGDTCRAYVTLFNDPPDGVDKCGPDTEGCGSLAIIDLDPASARFHRVIRKIE
ncbi:MAG: hypothetical protein ABEN55_14995 [Bradymonadaceae bacterium]